MKAIIKRVEYIKESETQWGIKHNFKISYNDKSAYYTGNKKDQTLFVEGKESEFTEEELVSKKGQTYFKVKGIYKGGAKSNYGRQVQKEQSRYSGFAMAYAKDLLVAGKIETISQMYAEAQCMIDFMVEADKQLKG